MLIPTRLVLGPQDRPHVGIPVVAALVAALPGLFVGFAIAAMQGTTAALVALTWLRVRPRWRPAVTTHILLNVLGALGFWAWSVLAPDIEPSRFVPVADPAAGIAYRDLPHLLVGWNIAIALLIVAVTPTLRRARAIQDAREHGDTARDGA